MLDMNMTEFLESCSRRFCPECGEAIPDTRGTSRPGRPRVFCSDSCRKAFWSKHQNQERRASTEKLVCPVCGKVFLAHRETTRKRTYCSHACANRARARKEAPNDT